MSGTKRHAYLLSCLYELVQSIKLECDMGEFVASGASVKVSDAQCRGRESQVY